MTLLAISGLKPWSCWKIITWNLGVTGSRLCIDCQGHCHTISLSHMLQTITFNGQTIWWLNMCLPLSSFLSTHNVHITSAHVTGNTPRLGRYGRHFARIFKCIFQRTSLYTVFCYGGSMYKMPTLVMLIAYRRIASRRQSTWANDQIIHWHSYASTDLNILPYVCRRWLYIGESS